MNSSYAQKKADLRSVLTVYGRKSVLEALPDEMLSCQTLHMADSNRKGGIIADIEQRAAARGVPVRLHTRDALSRISRNGKQDQGVALDIACPAFAALDQGWLQARLVGSKAPLTLLAMDGVTNPQNVGMIIRSAAAAGVDGIIYPDKGLAALGPLVIKASVGTVFRAPLLRCERLLPALRLCQAQGIEVSYLDGNADISIFEQAGAGHRVYVLGGETHGVSAEIRELADTALSIPMAGGVESLNVAVSAALVAYASQRR